MKLPSYTFYDLGNVVLAHKKVCCLDSFLLFSCCCCSCCFVFVSFFSPLLVFQLAGLSHISFSHRRYLNFHVVLRAKFVSFVFISSASSFYVIHLSVDIKA